MPPTVVVPPAPVDLLATPLADPVLRMSVELEVPLVVLLAEEDAVGRVEDVSPVPRGSQKRREILMQSWRLS